MSSELTSNANKMGSAGSAKTAASSVTAKTESATLAAANPARVALYVTNDGEKVVYLALGATATKNKGIRLNANGGAAVIDNYTGVVSVVTATGESVVCISEV